jgi:hypothetical protein
MVRYRIHVNFNNSYFETTALRIQVRTKGCGGGAPTAGVEPLHIVLTLMRRAIIAFFARPTGAQNP